MVTFTNDAAINMKKRLKQMFVNYHILTGKECYLQYVEGVDRANISTIHKFSLELLRSASFYTGLGTTFRISSDGAFVASEKITINTKLITNPIASEYNPV